MDAQVQSQHSPPLQPPPPPRRKRRWSFDQKDDDGCINTTLTINDEKDVSQTRRMSWSGDGMTTTTTTTTSNNSACTNSIATTSCYLDGNKRRRLSSSPNTFPFQSEPSPTQANNSNNNNNSSRHLFSTGNSNTTAVTTSIVMVVNHPLPDQVNQNDHHLHHRVSMSPNISSTSKSTTAMITQTPCSKTSATIVDDISKILQPQRPTMIQRMPVTLPPIPATNNNNKFTQPTSQQRCNTIKDTPHNNTFPYRYLHPIVLFILLIIIITTIMFLFISKVVTNQRVDNIWLWRWGNKNGPMVSSSFQQPILSRYRWFQSSSSSSSDVIPQRRHISSSLHLTPTSTTTTTIVNHTNNITSTTCPKPLTLRQILQDDDDIGFHLALAPAFFGFYGYFGMLSAWYDEITNITTKNNNTNTNRTDSDTLQELPIRSVVGASAGAMAAILMAAGIRPHDAMTFCSNITVNQYADFPGWFALFRGHRFEQLLYNFLISAPRPNSSSPILLLDDARIPVAVTAFDLRTMTTQILMQGSMARAARASATFPGLFQPVRWKHHQSSHSTTIAHGDDNDSHKDFFFIDGGVMDVAGTMGLSKTMTSSNTTTKQRVINLCVGSFRTMPGPVDLPNHPEVISIAIIGLPQPGPWAMSNGPIAYDIARNAMRDALDIPLQRIDVLDDNTDPTQHHDTTSSTCLQEQLISPHYRLMIKV